MLVSCVIICACGPAFYGDQCENENIGGCDAAACSHACFVDPATNHAQCACPGDMVLGDDLLTCQEPNNPPPISSDGFISEDGTWRPLLAFPHLCVFKKYGGMHSGRISLFNGQHYLKVFGKN